MCPNHKRYHRTGKPNNHLSNTCQPLIPRKARSHGFQHPRTKRSDAPAQACAHSNLQRCIRLPWMIHSKDHDRLLFIYLHHGWCRNKSNNETTQHVGRQDLKVYTPCMVFRNVLIWFQFIAHTVPVDTPDKQGPQPPLHPSTKNFCRNVLTRTPSCAQTDRWINVYIHSRVEIPANHVILSICLSVCLSTEDDGDTRGDERVLQSDIFKNVPLSILQDSILCMKFMPWIPLYYAIKLLS